MDIRPEDMAGPNGTGKFRSYKYPWDEWLDGQHRIAKRGEDFDKDTTELSFVRAIKRGAKRRGLGAHISVKDDGVHFQTFDYDTVDRAAHQ